MKGYAFLFIVLLGLLGSCTYHDKANVIDLDSKSQAGRRYYLRECGRCHQHYKPGDYTTEEWRSILARKRNKVSLTGPQFDELAGFLRDQAKGNK